MTVREIMTLNPICCTPDTSLEEVALMMCDRDCGEIPVVSDERSKRPIGVITDRDITCRVVAQGKDAIQMTAEDVMSGDCITVTPDASLEECCDILEQHQIRRAPVVDAQGRCCGIVSQADIARHAPKEKTAELLRVVSEPYSKPLRA